MAIQIDIGQVWDLKYHYCLDLTNTVPIWAKPAQIGSLAGRLPGQAGSQVSDWSHLAGGAATMCFSIATNMGHPIWAALLGVPEHGPGQQMIAKY